MQRDDFHNARSIVSTRHNKLGPSCPRLGGAGHWLTYRPLRAWARRQGFFTHDSSFAGERTRALREKLARGERAYLVGLGLGGHDSGAALVEVSNQRGIRLLSSHEEERFVGERHYAGHPRQALREIRADLEERGLSPDDIHACVASFDYVELFATGAEALAQELPGSLALLHPDVYPASLGPLWRAFRGPQVLAETLYEARSAVPVIGMLHHENHAAFAWATSPFSGREGPTLILVTDANGDDASFSVFLGDGGGLRRLFHHPGIWDSLGHFYAFLSSNFGRWPIGQAEGRWMAAAAFGSREPAQNPYYPLLRALISVDDQGGLQLDRGLASWHLRGNRGPLRARFDAQLRSMLGKARDGGALCFSYEDPDFPAADLAAACQLVFEETLEQLVRHWARTCGAQRLILTGGTALNCVANARLQQAFHGALPRGLEGAKAERYERFWTPPAPADEGTLAGCAMAFALRAGARPGAPLRHAFYCGRAPSSASLKTALGADPEIHLQGLEISENALRTLSLPHDPRARPCGSEVPSLAFLLALAIDSGAVIGLFRGRAEMGRRALGHRSILATPRSTRVRDRINGQVKYREPFRPLAPICTSRAARRWFEIPEEALADPGAYRWMAVSARARAETAQQLPGVVHRDGSARIQIVDPGDRLLSGMLQKLGELSGVEVALNTSLNVNAPIAQTPLQCARILKMAPALDAIFFLTEDQEAYVAWRNDHGEKGTPAIFAALQRWREAGARRRAGPGRHRTHSPPRPSSVTLSAPSGADPADRIASPESTARSSDGSARGRSRYR